MKQGSILLIDDEAAHRTLARRAITNSFPSLQVLEAASFKEAQNILSSNKKLLLIFLDLNLGNDSGFDILTMIRKYFDFESLPVAILSTSSMHQDINKSYALGANAYIIKSYDQGEYQNNVKEAVQFYIR